MCTGKIQTFFQNSTAVVFARTDTTPTRLRSELKISILPALMTANNNPGMKHCRNCRVGFRVDEGRRRQPRGAVWTSDQGVATKAPARRRAVSGDARLWTVSEPRSPAAHHRIQQARFVRLFFLRLDSSRIAGAHSSLTLQTCVTAVCL